MDCCAARERRDDNRPDKDVQEFRREIAQYVNAKELGRLERYIIIN